jgi:uncharacterized membrane protein YtjA (UPF0391 family)
MKTDNRIPIKCGFLVFERDRLSIFDNSRTIHLITFTLLLASCALGFSYIAGNDASDEPVLFIMGILILLSSGLALGFMLTRTSRKELLYTNIHKIKLKKNYNGDFIANIKLRQGRIRYVALNNKKQDCDLFVNKTREHSIQTLINE